MAHHRDFTIRLAALSDAADLAELQRPYIEKTAINFLYTAPTPESFVSRIENRRYPFIVAEREGQLLGFAYASALRPHDAYGWDTELSVYIAEDHKREGIGSALYERLLAMLDAQGFLASYACITLPNPASIALHERFGFKECGIFPKCGYKFNAWHDVIWLVRLQEPMPEAPRSTLSVDQLDQSLLMPL